MIWVALFCAALVAALVSAFALGVLTYRAYWNGQVDEALRSVAWVWPARPDGKKREVQWRSDLISGISRGWCDIAPPPAPLKPARRLGPLGSGRTRG